MDAEFIMVEVVDADQPIETRSCRLLNLADGSRAALWRGLAWPLSPGDRIEVSGRAYPLFATEVEDRPLFGIIDGVEEASLVLDGSVTLRDAAVAMLQKAGITVLRSGPWLGDPVDGIAGSSFVRFIRPDTDDLRQSIGRILEGTLAPAKERADPTDQVRLLTVQLMEARAELARARLEKAEGDPSVPRPDVEAEIAAVRQENVALTVELATLQEQFAVTSTSRPQVVRPSRRLEEEMQACWKRFDPTFASCATASRLWQVSSLIGARFTERWLSLILRHSLEAGKEFTVRQAGGSGIYPMVRMMRAGSTPDRLGAAGSYWSRTRDNNPETSSGLGSRAPADLDPSIFTSVGRNLRDRERRNPPRHEAEGAFRLRAASTGRRR